MLYWRNSPGRACGCGVIAKRETTCCVGRGASRARLLKADREEIMDRREFLVGVGSATVLAWRSHAFAQMGGALLDHAEPGVALTVTGQVRDLRLYFNQSVLAAASSVQVTNSAGVAIPTTRPVGASRPTHCDRPFWACASTRQLSSELACGFDRSGSGFRHISIYSLLRLRCNACGSGPV
jgi:hypothetical protein